jgi:diguanylate cyclase (GGDEF)-like protein/PAS domain S-box-containing protein
MTGNGLNHDILACQLPLKDMHHVPVQGYNAQRRVIYWNRASEQLYGYRAEEALGKALEELIIPEPLRQWVVDAIKQWVSNGTPVLTEPLTLQHKDGSPVNVLSSHTLCMGPTGPEMYCIDIPLGRQPKVSEQADAGVGRNHCNKLEPIICQIATRFLSLPVERIDDGIHWALHHLGDSTHSARCYLILLSEDGKYIRRSHEWCAEGIAPRMQELPTVASSEFTWIMHHGEQAQIYRIDHANWGELSQAERQWFQQGVLLAAWGLPIVHDGHLYGFLGIDDLNADQQRPDTELHLLQIAATVIGAALARRALETRLRYEANHDTLTGVFNRRWFQNVLDHEIRQSERYQREFALILFDIDHFKWVNDQHGHHAGDRVLCQLVELITQRIRSSDVLARWGGEEFILLLPETSRDNARRIAEMLRCAVEQENFKIIKGLTISLGITYYETGDKATPIIRRADAALYAAKHQGRNRSIFQGR